MESARKIVGLLAALTLLLVAGIAPASALTRTDRDPFVAEVLKLTNQYRAEAGLPPVVWNQTVANISQQWAEEQNNRITRETFKLETIHREGYGSRQIPAGWDWYTENIGINNNARQIVDWWMNSPAHRAGMLSPKATDIGIGWMKTTNPDYYGMYVVVENLAGYAQTRESLPPAEVPSIHEGDIAAVDGSGHLYIYPSAQGGDLWQRSYVSSGWEDALQVDIADWNADGVQDILATWRNGKLTVSYGEKGGGLAAPRTIGWGGWDSYDIEVAHWKRGYKRPGIVAKSLSSGRLYYYSNPAGGKPGARQQISTASFKGLETFFLDYDDDGRMDMIARTGTGSGQFKLYRSNGAGRFKAEYRRIIGSSGWSAMTHLSVLPDHLGDGGTGFLTRDTAGNIRYYKVTRSRIHPAVYIGRGGWGSLMLGS
ncbi:CAP domain-containing protein [Arthrobacter mobilis]|uniref:SCP domain-containing protein n=1 Tax=Arthrobacter mobilis TaxID=2724944 RepID=A0A7X6HDX8_9MICC|nr:CAP domain-containing protein [Arthrobacter mobilis]NKX55339.1 hypothetical protein [Arthrobacter mobilis]